MKKYVKYIGYNPSTGSYCDVGLTVGKFYEFQKLSESGMFVTIINDFDHVHSYSAELFE